MARYNLLGFTLLLLISWSEEWVSKLKATRTFDGLIDHSYITQLLAQHDWDDESRRLLQRTKVLLLEPPDSCLDWNSVLANAQIHVNCKNIELLLKSGDCSNELYVYFDGEDKPIVSYPNRGIMQKLGDNICEYAPTMLPYMIGGIGTAIGGKMCSAGGAVEKWTDILKWLEKAGYLKYAAGGG